MNPRLPEPDENAKLASQALCQIIQRQITQNNGWISFADYMQAALYTPQHGYYRRGGYKIGQDGDFITAPTLTPLFGQTLATQLAELLPQTAGNIYEFGAGTGKMALDIIQTLLQNNQPFTHYYIIEVSSELRQRQRTLLTQNLPEIAHKITHLDVLPDTFDGIILGNEVLDAMPCERICWRTPRQIEHVGVTWNQTTGFRLENRPLINPFLLKLAQALPLKVYPYTSELHATQQTLMTTLAEKLLRGAIIWIDYGFDAAQYYFSERTEGTLIGHYRHHTIHDPFFYPGLCDLSCHINFSAIIEAGIDAGLDLAGYTTQAHFLLNLNITEQLTRTGNPQELPYIKAAKACQKLLNQHEMGELFKVAGLGKGINTPWQGFCQNDHSYRL